MDQLQLALSGCMDDESWKFVEGYILKIDNRDDAVEYLQDLLDMKNPEHVSAMDAFLKTLPDANEQPEFVAYKKCAEREVADCGDDSKKKKKKSKQQLGMEKYTALFPPNPTLPSLPVKASAPSVVSPPSTDGSVSGRKSKTKYVPLFTGDEVKAVMLPGRNACDCCATKHKLVNNCLGCGRIVCLQEGSGPCMTCGQLVCSKEELEVLQRGTKRSDQLRTQLMRQGLQENGTTEAQLRKAVEYKDRLLEYDRSSARRTKVIDDEMDYFASDSSTFLSPQERAKLQAREEELHALRHNNRRARVSLDFAGRQVVLTHGDLAEENAATEAVYGGADAVVQSLERGRVMDEPGREKEGPRCDPTIDVEAPKFVPGLVRSKRPTRTREVNGISRRATLRNQDPELQELRDEGECLSMHQPWASLLVRGIKQDEGRTWYSPHRGRLWIASTSKPVDPQDLREMEGHYKALGVPSAYFPKNYPTGCLLGAVDVLECLPQSDYRTAYPEGDSNSPFVFVCANPRELLVKFPISGKHKIYKLDPPVHAAAQKGLERQDISSLPA